MSAKLGSPKPVRKRVSTISISYAKRKGLVPEGRHRGEMSFNEPCRVTLISCGARYSWSQSLVSFGLRSDKDGFSGDFRLGWNCVQPSPPLDW